MKFSGIIPPLITPLSGYDQLDVRGLSRLVDHVIDGGVHGIFVLGSTGEGPSLSYRLRQELIQRVCEFSAQRVPVLVCITDTSFVESIRLTENAADHGAAAVVLSTPYYFPAGQTELKGYVERLLPKLALPVLLYNMPSLTKTWFEIETVRDLIQHERIIGMKDSSGDLDYFRGLLSLRSTADEWSLLIGPEEHMIEATRAGGDGGVSGGANIFPQLFVAAYYAAFANDAPECQRLQQRIKAFGEIYRIGKYASRFIKATKCAAGLLGLCDDVLAEPFHRFYEADRQRVKAILDGLK